ncbi:unnamed protein product [Schistosoma curassoni]|uniref:DNA-directed DNA polymerase family A palm domain-containing protein n=1 Tax=Schistosoma curassoni TaxID=6186 RepID=A0A3P8DMX6_9TREM|nr:unnamed protein product [Schistosoma curassoni]
MFFNVNFKLSSTLHYYPFLLANFVFFLYFHLPVLNLNVLNKCHDSLLKACKKLESVAYRLAGQPFTMDSPKEISKVLFKWLHLPQITDPNDLIMNRKRNQSYLLNGRNRSSHLPKATNTLLSKLTNLHPLPAVIMEWRHINGILEKIFNSLVSTCRLIHASSIGDQPLRISPTYDVYTATGRIISIMPNLQSVPKDIIIDWSKLHYKSTTIDNNNLNNNSEKWTSPFDQILSELPKSIETIKPRCAFHAPVGGLLISGDFCQLELRLLAYFSKDVELLKLLSVVEYSSVQKFITTTVLTAHREGQIQTLNGHIRLLPALNSKTVFDSDTPYELNCNWSKKHDVRNHFAVIKAERQAVNNIIQGSASEIAKIAMLAVDQAIHSSNIPGYAHLVLHEHDELIYEVSSV